MRKVLLEIVALSHSLSQTQNYAVVLGEANGPRRIPIVIGGFEAQSIAVAMEHITPSRPLTHDLVKNLFTSFDVELKEVLINNLVEGIFYAQLVCNKNGEQIEIDSRTSDALALAVRFDCPIYTFDFIIEEAGIILEELGERMTQEVSDEKNEKQDLEDFSDAELEEKLNQALSNEEYEEAARIRDEIKKRSKN